MVMYFEQNKPRFATQNKGVVNLPYGISLLSSFSPLLPPKHCSTPYHCSGNLKSALQITCLAESVGLEAWLRVPRQPLTTCQLILLAFS